MILHGCSGSDGDSDDASPGPLVTIQSDASAEEGETLALTASVDTGTVRGFTWSQIDGPAALLDGGTTSSASAFLPLVLSTTNVTFQVEVSLSDGTTAIGTRTVAVESAPTGESVAVEVLHNNLRRTYTVYTPSSALANAPLVLFLHGAGGSMRELGSGGSRWYDLADSFGFVLAFPNGFSLITQDGLGDSQFWANILSPTSPIDDVDFLAQVVDDVTVARSVDPFSVFLAGRSSGGMMTMRALIEEPNRYRAGAALLATMPTSAPPLPANGSLPPMMLLNGTDDPVIPFGGGTVTCEATTSIADVVTLFLDLTGSNATTTTSTILADFDPTDGCTVREDLYRITGQSFTGLLYYEVIGGRHNCPDPGAAPEIGQCR
ncbi:MAG: PHB depolymerase family esterase, partial [Planctomycetota bacterium]